MPENNIYICLLFLSLVKYSILSDEIAIYERCSDIINHFSEDKELANILLDLVDILLKQKSTIFNIIDHNIQRIFTDSNDRYKNEFSIYYYKENKATDTDEDMDEVEQDPAYY
ncbi:hypothetical protein RhiirB3_425855 [Rhizophagus irregularis]|nr:hypothetical protein RhiirB3_425855 [Rhizophagus irregularis]